MLIQNLINWKPGRKKEQTLSTGKQNTVNKYQGKALGRQWLFTKYQIAFTMSSWRQMHEKNPLSSVLGLCQTPSALFPSASSLFLFYLQLFLERASDDVENAFNWKTMGAENHCKLLSEVIQCEPQKQVIVSAPIRQRPEMVLLIGPNKRGGIQPSHFKTTTIIHVLLASCTWRNPLRLFTDVIAGVRHLPEYLWQCLFKERVLGAIKMSTVYGLCLHALRVPGGARGEAPQTRSLNQKAKAN